MSLLLPHQVTPNSRIGGKARALLALSQADLPIPAWAALPGDADLPTSLPLETLGPGPFAVRSSAMEEDGATQSFAGQFTSVLFVPREDLRDRILEVRHSAHNRHLEVYRAHQAASSATTPGVLIQEMIHPVVSGVAFSSDPVSGERRVTVISAVWGVGSGLVSGECDADCWRLDREGHLLEETIARKSRAHHPDPSQPEGTAARDVPEERQTLPCLQPEQVQAVRQLAQQCQEHFGCPQDIEWAIDGESRLWLLQSRPITTLATLPDPGDAPTVWDNSNIAESYSGVTTPLTFSFALRAYEHVYREFCRLLRVSEERIEASDEVFAHMLGLVQGRVYYNLVSWYRVLALLPGFQINRAFMEQMMGLKEPLPEEIVEEVVRESRYSKWKDRRDLVRTLCGLVRSHRRLPRDIARFEARLSSALSPPAQAWSTLSAEELVRHYRDLEKALLRRWDAPLVNDFFAMIFYGVLRRLCQKWLGDSEGTLQNELLLDTGDIISAEPPRRIRAMARLAAADPALVRTLADHDTSTACKRRALREHEQLSTLFDRYLADFGDRCLEELKLESPTVTDDPGPLLASIGNFALRGEPEPPEREDAPALPRLENPCKRLLFSWVLRQTRRRVRDRENLRFERTRLFGRVRTVMRELGRRLAAEGRLAEEADIFYLTLEEILALYDGTALQQDLRPLVSSRREEFDRYRHTPPPPDRFETRGPLYRHQEFVSQGPAVDLDGDSRQGTGACAGCVRGPVRVVSDPRQAVLAPDEILVAQQTDPGWVVLFPSAAGLLVERGSLLSHSAIVSREMNLPCIVSLSHITSWLQTGDWVEMDGKTGIVRKIAREE